MRAAVGFSSHSGWAVMVAVGGDSAAPEILARLRIQSCPDDLPREAYHAASLRPRDEAPAVIARVVRAAEQSAVGEVRSLRATLASKGYHLLVAGVPGVVVETPRPLASVLKVHALLHKAEGELYREALAAGCESAGLAVRRFAPGAALDLLQSVADGADQRLSAWGKALGPPWTRDEREAAAAAWFALQVHPHSSPGEAGQPVG